MRNRMARLAMASHMGAALPPAMPAPTHLDPPQPTAAASTAAPPPPTALPEPVAAAIVPNHPVAPPAPAASHAAQPPSPTLMPMMPPSPPYGAMMQPPWWMYGPPPGAAPQDAEVLRQVLHTVTEIRAEQGKQSQAEAEARRRAVVDEVLGSVVDVIDVDAHYQGAEVLSLIRATLRARTPLE
jgi:hypothetical protein